MHWTTSFYSSYLPGPGLVSTSPACISSWRIASERSLLYILYLLTFPWEHFSFFGTTRMVSGSLLIPLWMITVLFPTWWWEHFEESRQCLDLQCLDWDCWSRAIPHHVAIIGKLRCIISQKWDSTTWNTIKHNHHFAVSSMPKAIKCPAWINDSCISCVKE